MGKNSNKKNRRSSAGRPAGESADNAGSIPASMLNYAHAASSGSRNTEGAATVAPKAGAPDARYIGGLACLVLAVVMTLFLIVGHFNIMALPGCGEGGGCAEVTTGYWGKIPFAEPPANKGNYPVSFIGFAYFAGLLVAWAMSRGVISAAFRNLIRLGVAFSLMFIFIMLKQGHLCWYCLFTHLGNIGFWSIIEFGRLPSIASFRSPGIVAGVFSLASISLFVVDRTRSAELAAQRDKDADESVKEIIASSQDRTSDTSNAGGASTTIEDTASSGKPTPAVEVKLPPFTGRYRWGPEAAPVRMLMFTDYQCPDCRAVESVARRILAEHKDVSLSIKHFPMDQSCNTRMSKTLHANACWAARAAETAGILHGDTGFWEMHHWLFDRRGSFTDAELNVALGEMGYNPQEFISIMTGPQTLELVQMDIQEAYDVAVFFTPMIFINGVHLRGVFEQNADKLRQSVETLLAQNLPALTAASDRKPSAAETVVGDWKEERSRPLPPDPNAWLKGPADARVKIVMWADYQEQWTVAADQAIRAWMQGKPDVSYSYRHFPFNQECNEVVLRTAFPNSCVAARAAEAAGALGGVDAFWRMHEWLMANQPSVNQSSVVAAAAQMGLDSQAFMASMASEPVASAIRADCLAAKPTREGSFSLLYRGGIPTIYINGRAVPRFRLDQTMMLDKILDAAYAGE
ncbi:MAG: DsbA family protein [Phycisphaerae bacterium]|nr:DsbA family protein [Phycisphaerae bacterium]